jgi:GMP synthase-like glutamine amidotransferase
MGSVEGVFRDAGLAFQQIDLCEVVPDRLPLEDAAGLVILGGPMSANDVDLYAHLEVELDWIREAIACELPTLGICLGAQLMAKALGGRVYRHRRREVGWFELEWTPEAATDRLFGGQTSRTVFEWHGDTFDLPAGAVQLARSRSCEHQAFRYGEYASTSRASRTSSLARMPSIQRSCAAKRRRVLRR